MLKVVHEESASNEADGSGVASLLDEIVRDGARQMLAAALQAEVAVEAASGAVQRRLRGPAVETYSPRSPHAEESRKCLYWSER